MEKDPTTLADARVLPVALSRRDADQDQKSIVQFSDGRLALARLAPDSEALLTDPFCSRTLAAEARVLAACVEAPVIVRNLAMALLTALPTCGEAG